jgi:hypothetical protein
VLLQDGNFVIIDDEDAIKFQTGVRMRMDPSRCAKESQIAAGTLGMRPLSSARPVFLIVV